MSFRFPFFLFSFNFFVLLVTMKEEIEELCRHIHLSNHEKQHMRFKEILLYDLIRRLNLVCYSRFYLIDNLIVMH